MTKKEIKAVLFAQLLEAWRGYYRQYRSMRRHEKSGNMKRLESAKEERDRYFYATMTIWDSMKAFGIKEKEIRELHDKAQAQASHECSQIMAEVE